MNSWYSVKTYRAHKGTGKRETVRAFIYAHDVVDVLDRYRRMPGVKKSMEGNCFPEMYQLSEEDGKKLEQRILQEKRIPLKKAKNTWYYDYFI